jgi:hypothetical protein
MHARLAGRNSARGPCCTFRLATRHHATAKLAPIPCEADAVTRSIRSFSTSERKYAPVGYCIYCGATRHSAVREKLGDEHVIPEGLIGELLLPLASCGRHEGITGSVEQFCQKETLGALRYQIGAPTKRPKERPTTLPVRLLINGHWQIREVPIAEFPLLILMPYLQMPDMLVRPEDRKPDAPLNFYSADFSSPELRKSVMDRYGATHISSDSGVVNLAKFVPMLAKIAHAFACAEIGRNNFRPLLLDVIEQKSVNPFDVIGGIPEEVPPDDTLHELGLHPLSGKDHGVLVVSIRLFSNLGFPVYYCVAGEL